MEPLAVRSGGSDEPGMRQNFQEISFGFRFPLKGSFKEDIGPWQGQIFQAICWEYSGLGISQV